MARSRVPSLLVAVLAVAPSLACGGPLCDLDARHVGADARFTTPLSSYDAVVETSDRWLRPERPVADSGEELDGLVLRPSGHVPTVTTLSCRGGALVERDGQAPEGTMPCDDGFGLGDGAGTWPAEVRVRLSVSEPEAALVEPPEGFTAVEYVAVEGGAGCPVRGYLGTLTIDTERL